MASDEHWIRVASLTEFGETRRLVRDVNGMSVLLLRQAAGVTVVRNSCTHLGKPLEQGRVMAGRIFCPFHGACFDLTTGEAVSGPAVTRLQVYRTKVEGDEVFVATPA
ncbi:MAG TPA: Rieske (2Fe-2S) protein [Steroidobacteraceae bacterium]|nr:Rieske (2Fe-2S) protein [Steroidobacteraceae bacterium]